MRLYLYGLGVWLLIMVLAFANGTLRQFALNKLIGPAAGHIVSTIILLTVFLIIAYYFVRANAAGHELGSFVLVGVLWLALTLAFEFLVGHYVMRQPWEKLLADYNLAKGRVWVFVPVATLLAPIVFFQMLRRK